VGLDVEFVPGFHGEAFGVLGTHPYRDDAPGAGFVIGYAMTGLFLTHYALWMGLSLLGEGRFLILEDDALFPMDWQKRLDEALSHTPDDTDILLIGSSNTQDKAKKQISGPVWEVKYPFCTHAYVVWSKALPVLLSRMRDCYTNIDIAMVQRAYPHLKVLTVLPRIVTQRNMELAE
jgi:GR25 family glycosyltransferase involved in LPS biosynthesis